MTLSENNLAPPILTVNFTKLAVAFHQAIARKEIIGVVSPGGIGFKYTLRHFAEKHYLKVVYCTVSYSRSVSDVLLTLYRQLCNVKFSNLNYRGVKLHELVLVLNYRLRLGDGCLLCIDGCSNLTPSQLKYFVEFLQRFDKPIGLVFRMSEYYVNQLATRERFKNCYEDLIKVVDNWRVLNQCSEDEIRDIAAANIADPVLVNDLVTISRGNLSLLNKHIQRLQMQARRPTKE